MHRIVEKWFWATAFAALSLLDLCLTWRLVEYSQGCVYEANPVAAWVLEQHGWSGLAVFKLVSMTLVLGLGFIVSRQRPRLAQTLFAGATGSLLLVTTYSLSLWTSPALASEESSLADLHAESASLEQQRVEIHAYNTKANRLSEELIGGRVSLADAAEILEAHRAQSTYDPLRFVRDRYPGLGDEACISASLIRGVAARLQTRPALQESNVERLARDFEERYHVPLPPFARFESHGEEACAAPEDDAETTCEQPAQ